MRLRNILFISLFWASASMAIAQNDNEVVRIKYNSAEVETFPRSSISRIDFSYSQMYDEENLAEQLKSNPDSVMALLYPKETTAFISELMTDNQEDINAAEVVSTRLNSLYPADDYIFSYQATPANAYYSLQADTPLRVWNTYCEAIHRCNLVLQNTTDRALQGEAYLCRAWLHFQLATVFSPIWRDDLVSAKEKGLPYMKTVEHGQKIEDSRLSVAEFYNQLELDLVQGLAMVGDAGTAYRFNLRSANAFAARFYLMKREWAKVLQYADAALGTGTPELRDWTEFEECMYVEDFVRIWFGDSKTNLMLQDTSSLRSRRWGYRYGIIGEAVVGLGYTSIDHYAPIIPGHTGYNCLLSCIKGGGLLSSYDGEVFTSSKLIEVFEYTDEEAGIGFVHNFYIPFSVGETLFARAEARLYLGDWAGCLEDLNLWVQNADESTFDLKKLHDWCEKNGDYFHLALRPADVSSSFVMPQSTFTDSEGTTITFEELLQCLVHMRRMETYGQDCRLFDLKRYGMPVVHNAVEPQSGTKKCYTMSYDGASDNHYFLPLPTENIVLGTPYYDIQFNDGTHREISNIQVEHIDFSADLDAGKRFAESIEDAQNGFVVQSFENLKGSCSFEEDIPVFADGVFMIGHKEMKVDGYADGTWFGHNEDYYGRTEYQIFPCPYEKEDYDHRAINQGFNAFVFPYYVIKHDDQVIDSLTVCCRKAQTDFTRPYSYKYQDAILRKDGSTFVIVYTPDGFCVKKGLLTKDCSLEFVGDEQNITFTSSDRHYTIEPDWSKYVVNSRQTLKVNAPTEEISAALSAISSQYTYYGSTLELNKQRIVLTFRQGRTNRTLYYNVQISPIENGIHIDIDWNDYIADPANAIYQQEGILEAINHWLAQLVGDYILETDFTLREISNESVDYVTGENCYENVDSWGNRFPMNLRSAELSGTFIKVSNPDIVLRL